MIRYKKLGFYCAVCMHEELINHLFRDKKRHTCMLEEFLSTSDPVAQRFPNLYFSSSLTVEFLQVTFDP